MVWSWYKNDSEWKRFQRSYTYCDMNRISRRCNNSPLDSLPPSLAFSIFSVLHSLKSSMSSVIHSLFFSLPIRCPSPLAMLSLRCNSSLFFFHKLRSSLNSQVTQISLNRTEKLDSPKNYRSPYCNRLDPSWKQWWAVEHSYFHLKLRQTI